MLRRVADSLFGAFVLAFAAVTATILFRIPGFFTVFALIIATILGAGVAVEMTRRSLTKALIASAGEKEEAVKSGEEKIAPDFVSA
ncbi:hypothetical protein EPN96_01750 [bacterium]|nr:MAG: hypothetical protein EPN96_01750 [bacterium]